MMENKNQQNNLTSSLMNNFKGLFEPKKHALMLWNREKVQIIKPKYYRFILNTPLYLVDREHAYGIIKLKAPQPLSITMFKNLRDRHKISDVEKANWWGTKNKLYAYEFEFVERFRTPKKLFPHEARTIIKNVEFVSDKFVNDLMDDVSNYSPKKLSKELLLKDWEAVLSWHLQKKRKQQIPFTMSKIKQIAKSIFREIYNREIEYTTNSLEDRDLVRELKINLKDEITQPILKKYQTLMDKYMDHKLINNFISIIKGELQINLKEDFKKIVNEKLKLMNEEVNINWDIPKANDLIPVYHLALVRAKPRVISLNEIELFEPMKPFIPLKSTELKDSTLFSNVDLLMNELYGGVRNATQ